MRKDIEYDLKLFSRYGINIPKYKYVRSWKENKFFKSERYVIKGYTKKTTHKTDIGGVMLNILPEKLAVEVQRLRNRLSKYDVEGILVQEQVPRGIEVIVGAKRDHSFGNIVLFGLGGISVELWKDVSIRLCPLKEEDINEMIDETKAGIMFNGFRGSKAINRRPIFKLIKSICKIMQENSDIKEIDINPLIIYPDSYYAVDIRVIR